MNFLFINEWRVNFYPELVALRIPQDDLFESLRAPQSLERPELIERIEGLFSTPSFLILDQLLVFEIAQAHADDNKDGCNSDNYFLAHCTIIQQCPHCSPFSVFC